MPAYILFRIPTRVTDSLSDGAHLWRDHPQDCGCAGTFVLSPCLGRNKITALCIKQGSLEEPEQQNDASSAWLIQQAEESSSPLVWMSQHPSLVPRA